MSKLFGTFNGKIDKDSVDWWKEKATFNDLVYETGEKIEGEIYINEPMVIQNMKLKTGNRYMIGFKDVKNGHLIDVNQTKKLRKIKKCDIFRRFKDEFHFVGGKHQGKIESELDKHELNQYCIWIVRNSYNEITIKNALDLLKKLHN